jgi:hypothetical protein
MSVMELHGVKHMHRQGGVSSSTSAAASVQGMGQVHAFKVGKRESAASLQSFQFCSFSFLVHLLV